MIYKLKPTNLRFLFSRCLLPILTLTCAQAEEKTIFREDFKEVPAHIPVTDKDLTSNFLTLERHGPGADQLKLSHHPEIAHDPHYIWNGECQGAVLIAFSFKKKLNLTGGHEIVRLRSKNFGPSTLHIALRSGHHWWVQKEPVANAKDWNVQSIVLHKKTWHQLDTQSVKFGAVANNIDFSKIDAIGFAAPHKPDRSKDCIRLDWFELIINTAPSVSAPARGAATKTPAK